MKAIIFINVEGLDGMIDAMQRVSKPSFLVTHELEGALSNVFAQTQANTHIISGRLKASGRTNTSFNGKEWSGTIEYGGDKYIPTGTNLVTGAAFQETAYYDVYEKARGGGQDFFKGLESYDNEFEKDIESHFKDLD